MGEFSSREVSFTMLDAELGSALTGIAPSDFLRQVQWENSEVAHTGEVLTGRQILRIDHHFYMTEPARIYINLG